ncbi:MAG: ribonuclease Z [Bacteroidales bacterium]|nr:ribonuclease Z [Bacteroidales bacterium]
MSFLLTVLGSSSALPTSKRYPSAHVLNVHEHFFLIDCGEGTQLQLRKFKFRFSKINHIFISHLHGDHVFGLPGLISTFNLLGRKSELCIYGHMDLKQYLSCFLNQFGHDLLFNVKFIPVKANHQMIIFENNQVVIESFPLRHRIPATGFLFREKEKDRNIRKEAIGKYDIGISDIVRIKQGEDYITRDGQIIPNHTLTIPPYKGRTYAYCSDTLYHKSLAERIRNVDLLYHEATFMDKDKKLAKLTMHSTAAQAAGIAKLANAGRLLIGHFSSRYKDIDALVSEAKTIFANTDAVEDGNQYHVSQQRKKDEK